MPGANGNASGECSLAEEESPSSLARRVEAAAACGGVEDPVACEATMLAALLSADPLSPLLIDPVGQAAPPLVVTAGGERGANKADNLLDRLC